MESLLAQLPQHGYAMLSLAVFLETIGFPFPAALALLLAGGASARGTLDLSTCFVLALIAMILGDTIRFVLGRYTGWWLLGILCRLSLNRDGCILRAADSFHRRGRALLVFAKFVPGINSIAPPMAGSMNMRAMQFLRLDGLGALLYTSAYLALGFVFSDMLEAITHSYQTFSRVLSWIVALAIVGYAGTQIWIWWSSVRSLGMVPLVEPAEAARKVAHENAVIYDVRSHGYYDPKATRVRGSIRLDPNALRQMKLEIPVDRQIYLYCTCTGEATSARVANELLSKGVRVAVIRGGLRSWKRAGLPLEPIPAEEIDALPLFT
jgi:membrane protein DedA with SNARE-associated domain/rhodanese-related sulfurtransferase